MTVDKRKVATSKQRVTAARALSANDFNVWKHYEDRAHQFGQELWSVGSWLAAFLGATLTLPFVANFITPLAAYPYIAVSNRSGVVVAAGFGILLCIYAYFAISDVRDHIESNWRKAGYVLEGTWQSDWTRRKNHGWIVLLVIGWLAVVAFASLFLIAFLWPAT